MTASVISQCVVYDPKNNPVEVLYSCFRGDTYKLRVHSRGQLFERRDRGRWIAFDLQHAATA